MNDHEQLPENPLSFEEAKKFLGEMADIQARGLALVSSVRGRSGVDQRWLAIGATDFEKGMMGITRAVMEKVLREGMEDAGR